MSTNNDSNTSTGGVGSGEETPPSSSLKDAFDVLTLAPSSSSPADKSTNGMHFAIATVIGLSAEEIAIVFSYLPPKEIMCARVCTTWRDAVKKTLVPLTKFEVKSMRSYNALRAFSIAVPNMQQLSIGVLGKGSKYADGEDPDEEQAAHTANYTAHDLNIISNFRKLRVLDIDDSGDKLNGRYPFLFNFPLLQSLALYHCFYLKWDLDMLSGCPLLRKLRLNDKPALTGDLKSLRVLKKTLETVIIVGCHNIQGNFMDLADFPHLKELSIVSCPILGDIRNIKEDDFPSLEWLRLPSNVIGGYCYEFQRISDVPNFMHAIHPLLKRFPEIFNCEKFNTRWRLSNGSADWYEEESDSYCVPPFEIECVLALGSRWGWRWSSTNSHCQTSACEVNWLDPEPSVDSDGYEKYVECMQRIEYETYSYRGYYEPPTEEEYRRLSLQYRRLSLRDRGD